jgi:hypothetical protein
LQQNRFDINDGDHAAVNPVATPEGRWAAMSHAAWFTRFRVDRQPVEDSRKPYDWRVDRYRY